MIDRLQLLMLKRFRSPHCIRSVIYSPKNFVWFWYDMTCCRSFPCTKKVKFIFKVLEWSILWFKFMNMFTCVAIISNLVKSLSPCHICKRFPQKQTGFICLLNIGSLVTGEECLNWPLLDEKSLFWLTHNNQMLVGGELIWSCSLPGIFRCGFIYKR